MTFGHEVIRGNVSLSSAELPALRKALAGSGLWLDVGIARIHVRSDIESFAAQLQSTYRAFPLLTEGEWADLHITISHVRGLRRWFRPQSVLTCDGRQPFEPFPADHALPMFEWGCNWLIANRSNDFLLLHAGVVERDGCALILPALPGSGKSTLTSALSLRGWRLLSDEFGACDCESIEITAVLKPPALKNQSIDVIRNFATGAPLGPEFTKTRKGTVAHLAASPDAVARLHERASPAAVVLPQWSEGSETRFVPMDADAVFRALAFNAFNYMVTGSAGFKAAVELSRRCLGWQLVYSDLNDAIAQLDAMWPGVMAHHRQFPS